MGEKIEIERRFLLSGRPEGLGDEPGADITQGYAEAYLGNYTARLRSMLRPGETTTYWANNKTGSGIARLEKEEPLAQATFELFWPLTKGRRLEKIRRLLGRWEIDQFTGKLDGLWLAEIELASADEDFYMPEGLRDVIIREVTDEPAFNNYALSKLDASPSVVVQESS